MWVFYENPECKTLADVVGENEIPKLREKARIACIPTSAGTGSEEVLARLGELAEKALGDVCTPTAPIIPTKEEMMELIKTVYLGA